jgi:hypothetical protein
MKKVIAVLFAAVMLFSAACADSVDVASMSSEDLIALVNAAKNELVSRKAEEDGKIFLVDKDDVQVYWTGRLKQNENKIALEVIFINNTNEELSIFTNYCILNGWQIDTGFIDSTVPGAKRKCEFTLQISDSDVSDMSQVETLELDFYSYVSDTFERHELGKTSLVFSDGKVSKVE